jgi:hypothetical protein
VRTPFVWVLGYGAAVRLEIDPAPEPDVEEAVERALERLEADRPRVSVWWLAGVRENTQIAGVSD